MKISCKMCGANLKFVPSLQKVCCEHCGSQFDPEEMKYDDSIGEECEQYTCNSCGAELLSFGKTGVVRCVYCGSKEFVKGKANKNYILQGIFPFKVDKEQFIRSYEQYFKVAPGIDKEFVKKAKEANITSLYLPYSFANNFFRKQYAKELNVLLEEVIPFDFKELKKMNPIYLDECFAEIVKTKKEENDIKTDDPSFYWVPIWLAEIEYENQIYYVVMNGQTWEMAGYYYKRNGKYGNSKEDLLKRERSKKRIRIICRMIGILLAIVLTYSIIKNGYFDFLDFRIWSLFIVLCFIGFDLENSLRKIFPSRIERDLENSLREYYSSKEYEEFTKLMRYTFFHVPPQQNKVKNKRK